MQLFHYYFQKERDSTTEARNPGRIATLTLHRRPQQFNIDTLTPRVRTADMLDLSPRAPDPPHTNNREMALLLTGCSCRI